MLFVVILFIVMVVWMVLGVLQAQRKARPRSTTTATRSTRCKTALVLVGRHLLRGGRQPLLQLDHRHVPDVFWNHNSVENNPQAVKIEINAHQWAWDARYAGPDGKFNTAGRHRHVERHPRAGRRAGLAPARLAPTSSTASTCPTCASSRTRCRA